MRDELGLPISIGVARTKHLAKIGSQVAKPDGLVVVDPATELAFLHDLPVGLMWGVGPVTEAKLAQAGVTTIGQLANAPGMVAGTAARAGGGREAFSARLGIATRVAIVTKRRAQSAGAQSALGSRPAEEGV